MDKQPSDIIGDFLKLMQSIDARYNSVSSSLERENKITTDLLHIIELEGADKKLRNRTATTLRTNRLDRRYYKDKLEELEPLHEFMQDKENKKTIHRLENILGKVRRVENYHADRTYKPRILTEKE